MGYKQYFVYMMTNPRKTVLYTGVTNSLERRVWEHKQKLIPGFTKKYNCEWLVHFEIYDEIDQAIAREKQIKSWIRAKKNALIAEKNPEWRDLAAEWGPRQVPDPTPRSAAPPPNHPAAPPAQDDTRADSADSAPPAQDDTRTHSADSAPPAQDDTRTYSSGAAPAAPDDTHQMTRKGRD